MNNISKLLMSENLLKTFEPYWIADSGKHYINPNDIIGFSLTEDQILKSGKLNNLIDRVKEVGWKPIHLSDFQLISLPNGKLIVGNGGNHRAYLSKKLLMDSVPANIEILLPESSVTHSTYIKIKELEEEKTELYGMLRLLKSKSSKKFDYKIDEKKRSSLYDKITLLEENINNLLLSEAKKLGELLKE